MNVATAQMSRKERRELLKTVGQRLAETGSAIDRAIDRMKSVRVSAEDLEEELDGNRDR